MSPEFLLVFQILFSWLPCVVLKPNYIYSVSWFHFFLMLLLCVLLMSRTIYQNLVTARIAKLDIYLLLRSLFNILTVGKAGEASAKY